MFKLFVLRQSHIILFFSDSSEHGEYTHYLRQTGNFSHSRLQYLLRYTDLRFSNPIESGN